MPLHKSFSEQNRFSKQRQWQRSKSHPAAAQAEPPRRPVTISAVTKSKLQKFEFKQPQCEPTEESTEKTDKRTVKKVQIVIDSDSDKENESSTIGNKQSPVSNAKNGTAVTPVSRLAWKDLIDTAEAQKDEEDDVSPNDRLLWHTERDAVASAISPMLRRRGKKRARSSSPASSPAYSKPATPTVNVQKLAQALKSPHADPAIELWDRFSVNGPSHATPLGPTNPLLAHLMVSSSPRPPKDGATSQSDSSLRRAISCGANWPKRRRPDRSEADSPSGPPRSGPRSSSKSSMVTALLKTVTGELNRAESAEVEDCLMRSPSPQKRYSPRKHHRDEDVFANDDPSGTDPEKVPSDYGDDDFEFDEDMLIEIDASLKPVQAEEAISQPPVVASEASRRLASKDSICEDDFDDCDDDLFAQAEDLIKDINPDTASQHDAIQQLPQVDAAPRTSYHQSGVDDLEDAYGDDFGGDFDYEAMEYAATQSIGRPSTSLPHASQKPRAIQRYLVTNVLSSTYIDDRGRESPEKVLVVQAERTSSIKTVRLRGDWFDTPANTKAYVHIIGDFESSGQCIIDNNKNILILHPDQLISATVVADSFSCMRRAVLQDRVKATSDASAPLVYGTLLHEIFQEALMANQWDLEFLGGVIDRAMKKHIEELYTIKVSFGEAKEHLLSKMKEMRYWAEAFISPFPKPNALVQGRNGEKSTMCVGKLLDVEEHVWSPMYGLKGNIDATVQVTVREGHDVRTLTVPFEVKTGKNVNSNHQAQTVLYNLLLTDRYDIEIAYGILYYMETSQTLRIPAIRHELRHMIMQRNQLACYVRERSVQLPPMKRSKNVCGKCYAQTSCFIYHKLADEGDGETSGMNDKFDQAVKHLTPKHKEFFVKWEDLLTKEEKESQKLRRELWTMVSSEREKIGRCFANVIIEEGSASEDQNNPKINRFHYTFIKENPQSGFSFLDSQLAVGEPIVVSDEQGHFALALGFVTAVRKLRISVAVDRRLHNARIRQPGFDEINNQVFASIMEVVPEGVPPEQSQAKIKEAPVRYRLDKDEFSNGMATVRNNLVQVMADGPFGSQEIRQLVVDLMPPTFKAVPTQYVITGQDDLNVDQQRAIEKVMSAKDYALVLGMPGTGKTTTIAHIIRALISQKKSVLLTSYTHTAVDNILLKLKKDKFPVLRLGAPAKVHPEVQDFAILAGQPMDTFEDIRSAWHDTPVVATTCLGINHPVFNERTFDYCIVDEASQITLPVCLGPIRMARTFVLVGDHNQLPPLVQNEEARVGGLDVSLFKLLSDTHPDSVVNLEHQYRMSEDIMTLSNTLIYEGRLKCGTEDLRWRKLDVPHMEALRRHHFDAARFLSSRGATQKSFCVGSNCWLRELLDPETRVSFINTDPIPSSREEAKGNRIVNQCEARVVTQLVEALLTVGVPPSEIGVMTHYRSQLSLLKHGLRGQSGIEMHTADRFQGRDKEVVVLSLVRSNEACNIGDLLKDWRRINVAFTRAKTKLLVVGSRDTLKGSGSEEMLSRFIGLMETRDWVHDLPADALESHFFDDAATQITATAATSQPSALHASRKSGDAVGSPPKPSAKGYSPKAPQKRFSGKENQPPGPRRAKIGERAMLKGKPVLRDILNDMTGGVY